MPTNIRLKYKECYKMLENPWYLNYLDYFSQYNCFNRRTALRVILWNPKPNAFIFPERKLTLLELNWMETVFLGWIQPIMLEISWREIILSARTLEWREEVLLQGCTAYSKNFTLLILLSRWRWSVSIQPASMVLLFEIFLMDTVTGYSQPGIMLLEMHLASPEVVIDTLLKKSVNICILWSCWHQGFWSSTRAFRNVPSLVSESENWLLSELEQNFRASRCYWTYLQQCQEEHEIMCSSWWTEVEGCFGKKPAWDAME